MLKENSLKVYNFVKENDGKDMTAYWFLFNMFAIARNNYKFKKRDKRVLKIQHIETDPLAPDAMQECLAAIDRLIVLTRDYLKKIGEESVLQASSDEEELQAAKDYLHQNTDADFTLFDEASTFSRFLQFSKQLFGITEILEGNFRLAR